MLDSGRMTVQDFPLLILSGILSRIPWLVPTPTTPGWNPYLQLLVGTHTSNFGQNSSPVPCLIPLVRTSLILPLPPRGVSSKVCPLAQVVRCLDVRTAEPSSVLVPNKSTYPGLSSLIGTAASLQPPPVMPPACPALPGYRHRLPSVGSGGIGPCRNREPLLSHRRASYGLSSSLGVSMCLIGPARYIFAKSRS